jgi:transposase
MIVNSKNECTNVFGARSKCSFVFSFSKRKNQRAFVRFLEKLLMRWGRVCLFVDNGPCHHGAILDAFELSHWKTLRIIYFPKYSPELNPVEQCWKPARKKLSNRVLLSLSAAKYHLNQTFEDETAMPKMFEYLSY